jgi:hypothetical protein
MRLVPPTPAARAAFACAVAVCALSSCKSSPFAHRIEKRTVNGFATALAAADAETLRKLSSSGFEDVALKDEAAVQEVKRLWPVEGKLEVVKVKDVPADELRDPDVPEKVVTVKDERGWKTDHRLLRDADSKKWVVDEILITQTLKGVKATKTISEQVAFVGFVRDFSQAWRNGDKGQRLANVTAECRAELEPLPDDVLDRLAKRMFPAEERAAAPEATMDEDIAFVSLRRPTGAVILQLKRIEGNWLVDDAVLEAGKDGESIPSMRKTAVAYAAAAKFLAAYNAADVQALESVATETFYNATLKSADLSMVPLPTPAAGENGRLTVVGDQSELVIDEPDRVVKLALVCVTDPKDVKALTEFRVEDVTLYEQGGQVKKRLAAALVAEPIAHLYADALLARNVSQLRVMATFDFAEQVWKHVPQAAATALPLADVHPGDRQVLSTVHNGAVTEVTMMQSGRALTYVLKDEGGEVKVDDVLMAVADRPASLKTTLVHMLPVLRLRAALAAGDVESLRHDCSADFNRLIWSQVRRVPPQAAAAARFLDAPLASLQVSGPEATVRLGDASYGGVVTLLEDRGAWKVHDLTLIAGPGPQDQAALKPLLRDGLANGTLFADSTPAAPTAGAIQQVGYEAPISSAVPGSPPTADFSPPSSPEPPLATEPIVPSNEPATLPQDDSALPFSEPLR